MTTAAAPGATARPQTTRLPQIKLLSWAGLESIGWIIVIGHLVKWAVDALYFLITQVAWGFQYPLGHTHTYWYLKRVWDHLPAYVGKGLNISWLQQASVDHAWVTPRHDARNVIIGIVAGVILAMLFTKPKHPAGERVSAVRYVLSLPLALLFAIPGVAVVAVLAWKLPWLVHHGLHVPAHYGALANEVNGWISAGNWIVVLMGLAGSQLFAKYASRKPADDAQWFYAQRSADKMISTTGLNRLRTRVIGTPAHRARVHWLLDNGTHTAGKRSAWSVRLLLAGMFILIVLAGIGAWLTLAGPAAGA